jgi:hypothetical protein
LQCRSCSSVSGSGSITDPIPGMVVHHHHVFDVFVKPETLVKSAK